MPHAVAPTVDRDDEFFWNGVAEGKLLARRCAHCRRLQQPPSPMCPRCGSLEWDVEELSGRGTLHSWIVSHHPSEPDDAPRIVGLVQLEEGIRMVSNLQGIEPAAVTNDMPLEVVFMDVDGVRLPQFRPLPRQDA
ncbi:MAG TPA: Zn-ribbon domain-containing OB-fold protein [Acidimicrobiales bacterium]|nr:Zn-ribbon domain-containing OB-fold protein [Acidimicrobiales bacterium]